MEARPAYSTRHSLKPCGQLPVNEVRRADCLKGIRLNVVLLHNSTKFYLQYLPARSDFIICGIATGNLAERLMKRRVFFLAVGIALSIAANAPVAQALPKQGTGGKCDCVCEAPSGINSFGVIQTFNTYHSHGLGCDALVGATCNVSNPNTGGVATGSVKACTTVTNASRHSVIILPERHQAFTLAALKSSETCSRRRRRAASVPHWRHPIRGSRAGTRWPRGETG